MEIRFEGYRGIDSGKFSVRDTKVFAHQFECILFSEKGAESLLTARLYTDKKGGGVYALLWVKCWDVDENGAAYRQGYGRVGGYGYHKGSAAIEEALNAAGIKLSEHVGGCGFEACKNAFTAVCEDYVSKKYGKDYPHMIYISEAFA